MADKIKSYTDLDVYRRSYELSIIVCTKIIINLDDAIAENNETIVSLCHVRDLYYEYANPRSIQRIIDEYEIVGKQLYKLKKSWEKFCQ